MMKFKVNYLLAVIGLSLIGVAFAQNASSAYQQVGSITSGIQGILLDVAVICLILGILLIGFGYYVSHKTFPAQKGRRIGGTILKALGLLIFAFGVIALIGMALLPSFINYLVSPNNLNLSKYQSQINSCIPTTGFSCSKPMIIYSGATGQIELNIQQNSGSNWTTSIVEFVNQSEEGIITSKGFNYSIPYGTVSNGMANGASITVSLPFAQYVKPGSPMIGYLWVAYTTPQDNKTAAVQMATIVVS